MGGEAQNGGKSSVTLGQFVTLGQLLIACASLFTTLFGGAFIYVLKKEHAFAVVETRQQMILEHNRQQDMNSRETRGEIIVKLTAIEITLQRLRESVVRLEQVRGVRQQGSNQ